MRAEEHGQVRLASPEVATACTAGLPEVHGGRERTAPAVHSRRRALWFSVQRVRPAAWSLVRMFSAASRATRPAPEARSISVQSHAAPFWTWAAMTSREPRSFAQAVSVLIAKRAARGVRPRPTMAAQFETCHPLSVSASEGRPQSEPISSGSRERAASGQTELSRTTEMGRWTWGAFLMEKPAGLGLRAPLAMGGQVEA